jgi:hypothetical protein
LDLLMNKSYQSLINNPTTLILMLKMRLMVHLGNCAFINMIGLLMMAITKSWSSRINEDCNNASWTFRQMLWNLLNSVELIFFILCIKSRMEKATLKYKLKTLVSVSSRKINKTYSNYLDLFAMRRMIIRKA